MLGPLRGGGQGERMFVPFFVNTRGCYQSHTLFHNHQETYRPARLSHGTLRASGPQHSSIALRSKTRRQVTALSRQAHTSSLQLTGSAEHTQRRQGRGHWQQGIGWGGVNQGSWAV